MEKHIPLISTRTIGPLGLVHLPRLWLNMRLAANGMLNAEYRGGEGGVDGGRLDSLGVELRGSWCFARLFGHCIGCCGCIHKSVSTELFGL